MIGRIEKIEFAWSILPNHKVQAYITDTNSSIWWHQIRLTMHIFCNVLYARSIYLQTWSHASLSMRSRPAPTSTRCRYGRRPPHSLGDQKYCGVQHALLLHPAAFGCIIGPGNPFSLIAHLARLATNQSKWSETFAGASPVLPLDPFAQGQRQRPF